MHPTCRLSVILARSAAVAVVLRRGPTRWVQMIRWRTDIDEFEAGQWFRGRIYDRRCDLSPDGALFIYFASKFNRRTLKDRDYTCAWTAISRPPYFTALALWPKGDCWHGGGLFLAADHVWLNHAPHAAIPHPAHQPRGLIVESNPEAHGEDGPIWSRRMTRDGWVLRQRGNYVSTGNGWRSEQCEIWERANPQNSLILRRSTDAISFRNPGGPYLESFRVITPVGDIPLQGATWADWDHTGRLIFARAGKLFSATLHGEQLVERELIDLNIAKPERLESPPWARQWPT